jgi:hypothetical protein
VEQRLSDAGLGERHHGESNSPSHTVIEDIEDLGLAYSNTFSCALPKEARKVSHIVPIRQEVRMREFFLRIREYLEGN